MKKTVLVIGANGALGSAVAHAIAEAGHNVVSTVSRAGKLDAFKKDMPEFTPAIALDLSDADRAYASLKAFVEELSRLDAVIACPALAPLRPLEYVSLQTLRETFEVNSVSAVAIYQATIDALRQSKGRLIYTSSFSGTVATPTQGAYCASKFALEAFIDVMRLESDGTGVSIISLQPGGFRTPTVDSSLAYLTDAAKNAPEEERARYGKLYLQMKYRLNVAIAAEGFMQASDVAKTALEALESPTPKPRYMIGAEASFLLNAKREKSDEEMDNLILDAYRSAPIL